MFGLDLKDIVEEACETSSIHIWNPPKASQKSKKDASIKSKETDDVQEVLQAYKKGSSLYFTSHKDFRDSFGKALSYHMGHDFAGYFPGTSTDTSVGDSITEIEIFVSRAGNYTDFHLDF